MKRVSPLSGGLLLLAFFCIFSALGELLPGPPNLLPALSPLTGEQDAGTDEQLAPTDEQPAPTGEQPAPTDEQPAPTDEQPAPTGEQPILTDNQPARTIILDPGHGGEDGGATTAEGTAESGINLEISLRLHDLLLLCGQPVSLTRTEDVSLGDPALGTVRARKASDIRKRVEIVNSTPGAVLVSIHQNSLPSSPVTHGAQVFWNRGGQELAEGIQDALNETVNAEKPKRAKEMGSAVYLMRHAEAPAALVECGFLSNGEEAARLQTADHQRELTTAIAAGVLRYLGNEA